MTPPTGLTFIVHALVVLVRKFLAFFGIGKIKPSSENGFVHKDFLPFVHKRIHRRKQAAISVFVIVLVLIYIGSLVSMFIDRALHDPYANWKVAGKTWHVVEHVITRIDWTPPSRVAERSDVRIPPQYYTEYAEDYITIYTSSFTTH